MNDNTTKHSLAKVIFYEVGISTSLAESFIDNVLEAIIDHAIKDKAVKIPKFGSFYLKSKKARIGRNLNTQEEVEISARNVISFQSSNHLKQAINDEV